MRKLTIFIISFITWILLIVEGKSFNLSLDWQGVFMGLFAALLTALIFGETPAENSRRIHGVKRCLWFIYFIPVFAYWCLIANLDVVYRVFHPKMPINPGIVKVRTNLKSKSGRVILCNSITLTPGTLSVDIDKDGYIYIHWINVMSQDIEEASKLIVVNFEKILMRIFE